MQNYRGQERWFFVYMLWRMAPWLTFLKVITCITFGICCLGGCCAGVCRCLCVCKDLCSKCLRNTTGHDKLNSIELNNIQDNSKNEQQPGVRHHHEKWEVIDDLPAVRKCSVDTCVSTDLFKDLSYRSESPALVQCCIYKSS